MTPLDLVIIIVYLFGIMAVGILAGYRKNASSDQFFLAGKTLRWPMVGAVLFTANISTIHLVGLSSAGFDVGVVVGNFEWMACFCLLLLGLLFVFFCLKSGITMLPEFLETRYNTTCRMIRCGRQSDIGSLDQNSQHERGRINAYTEELADL
ncbi:MAG: hypothetical protein R6V12_07375 [Candidatus Hydrogenedentota bacterium]